MRRRVVFPLLLLMVLTLPLSCRQSAPLAPLEPNVVLLSPSNGASLAASQVEVRVYIQNLSMVGATGQPNRASEGHAIYYLDVSAPLKADTPATTSPGTFAASAETSHTWTDVPPGEHTFTVQLVNNDNTPLNPPVTVRANVTLKGR